MKLNTALVAVCLFGTASAFAPQHTAAGTRRAPLTKLEMAYGAKRKAALKVAKKVVAGTVGSIALATTTLSSAANAAGAAFESAKEAKNIATVFAGAFAAGVATDKLLKKLSYGAIPKTAKSIEKDSHVAKPNHMHESDGA